MFSNQHRLNRIIKLLSLSPDDDDYLRSRSEIQRLSKTLGHDIAGSRELWRTRLDRDKRRAMGKTDWTASLAKAWQTIVDNEHPVAARSKPHRRKASPPKKRISRQRRWQLAREASGRCRSCSRRRSPESKWFCPYHLELTRTKNRERYRKRVNNKKR